MKPSWIIKLARRQTWCTEDIVTTEEAYKFLNFVIEDFGADLRASDSWYWFDVLNIDVTAWQASYLYNNDWGNYSNPDPSSPTTTGFPISKIQSVWLLDQNTGKWRDLPVHFVDKVNVNQFEASWAPRACFITRDDINLIPAPKENTTMQVWGWDYNRQVWRDTSIYVQIPNRWYNWQIYVRAPEWDKTWKLHNYAWKMVDWETYYYTDSTIPLNWQLYDDPDALSWGYWIEKIIRADREENIFIPRRWHYILVEWLKYWMYWNMWVNFETARTNSRAFYDNEKMKALQNIVDRGQLADTAYFPDLNFLNY